MSKVYIVSASYTGHDEALDERMAKAVGRGSDASGFGFGARDHSWYFEAEDARDLALANLRAAVKGDDVYARGSEMDE